MGLHSVLQFPPVTLDEAFGKIGNQFPSVARFQGVHFAYAAKNGTVLIERKIQWRFFYWLLVDDHFKLIHGSQVSRLAPLKTLGDSLTPSNYDPSTS